jgi:hypothetical protein
MHHDVLVRTTITIDDDVYEVAQAQAIASGQRLGSVVSKLVRAGLEASGKIESVKGMPVFKVKPGAAIIPTTRARDLLAEEPL